MCLNPNAVSPSVGRRFSPACERMRAYGIVGDAVARHGFDVAGLKAELESAGFAPPSRETLRRWAPGVTSPLSGKNLFSPRPSRS